MAWRHPPFWHLVNDDMDSTIEFYNNRLSSIDTEMKWCRMDMQSGIDYDYSQDRLDELVLERENLRLDLFSYKRRVCV